MNRSNTAADMSVFFLKNAKGTLSFQKLSKLLYLADRLSLKLAGHSITGDDYILLPSGPSLESVVKMVHGFQCSNSTGCNWSTFFNIQGSFIFLAMPYEFYSLGLLSEFSENVLIEIWDEFGEHSDEELFSYCAALPEVAHAPHGAIPLKEILKAVGYSDAACEAIEESQDERRAIDAVFANLEVGDSAA